MQKRNITKMAQSTIAYLMINGLIHRDLARRIMERSGSVVECSTRDRRAAGSSLTSDTALWSLSKTHLS